MTRSDWSFWRSSIRPVRCRSAALVDAHGGGTARGVLAQAPPDSQLLAVRHRSRRALVGGAVSRRLPSRPGAGADRAVHAARAADLGLFDPREELPAGYAEPLRALVGDARAIRAAAVWIRECGRAIRADRTGHVLRARGAAGGKADRHPAVFGRRAPDGRASAQRAARPRSAAWSASRRRLDSRCRCSSRQRPSREAQHWPKQRWARS